MKLEAIWHDIGGVSYGARGAKPPQILQRNYVKYGQYML